MIKIAKCSPSILTHSHGAYSGYTCYICPGSIAFCDISCLVIKYLLNVFYTQLFIYCALKNLIQNVSLKIGLSVQKDEDLSFRLFVLQTGSLFGVVLTVLELTV